MGSAPQAGQQGGVIVTINQGERTHFTPIAATAVTVADGGQSTSAVGWVTRLMPICWLSCRDDC
jgi:hypothetical protein